VTEPSEQALLGIGDQAPERSQAASIGAPHVLGRDEHARIVLGLKQDLDAPQAV